MSELLKDLKNELVPDHLVVDSLDFENEEQREAYIRQHPAKFIIKIDTEDASSREGAILWKDRVVPLADLSGARTITPREE